ncbi:hypothetical protein CPAV1605_344 [seawater metagenome]|uniref:CHCH domain-containing protein n=1 Tax=seawater metagenome TaxID=1561972 RepID=A0A5E8CJ27_9ZZZZ
MRKNKGFSRRSKTSSTPTKPRSNLPQKTNNTPPANVNNNQGSFIGSAGSAIGTGIGFGVGSSIGHAAFDKIFSGSNTTEINQNCEKVIQDFNKCITSAAEFGNDLSTCNQYIEMMKTMNCNK